MKTISMDRLESYARMGGELLESYAHFEAKKQVAALRLVMAQNEVFHALGFGSLVRVRDYNEAVEASLKHLQIIKTEEDLYQINKTIDVFDAIIANPTPFKELVNTIWESKAWREVKIHGGVLLIILGLVSTLFSLSLSIGLPLMGGYLFFGEIIDDKKNINFAAPWQSCLGSEILDKFISAIHTYNPGTPISRESLVEAIKMVEHQCGV